MKVGKNGHETAISGWKNGNLYFTMVEKLLELLSVENLEYRNVPKEPDDLAK